MVDVMDRRQRWVIGSVLEVARGTMPQVMASPAGQRGSRWGAPPPRPNAAAIAAALLPAANASGSAPLSGAVQQPPQQPPSLPLPEQLLIRFTQRHTHHDEWIGAASRRIDALGDRVLDLLAVAAAERIPTGAAARLLVDRRLSPAG